MNEQILIWKSIKESRNFCKIFRNWSNDLGTHNFQIQTWRIISKMKQMKTWKSNQVVWLWCSITATIHEYVGMFTLWSAYTQMFHDFFEANTTATDKEQVKAENLVKLQRFVSQT